MQRDDVGLQPEGLFDLAVLGELLHLPLVEALAVQMVVLHLLRLLLHGTPLGGSTICDYFVKVADMAFQRALQCFVVLEVMQADYLSVTPISLFNILFIDDICRIPFILLRLEALSFLFVLLAEGTPKISLLSS